MNESKPALSVDGLSVTERALFLKNTQSAQPIGMSVAIEKMNFKAWDKKAEDEFNQNYNLAQYYKARGLKYVAKENKNIVRRLCIFCILGKEHTREYYHLLDPFDRPVYAYDAEAKIIIDCENMDQKLAKQTESMRKRITELKRIRAKLHRIVQRKEIDEIGAEIARIEREMMPIIAKQNKIHDMKEAALGELMILEQKINGLL